MLELDNVTVRFGALAAVDGVSLRIAADDVLGLVGPNGAGKTTLFNAISGLVRPAAGSIRLDGKDIGRIPLFRRARLGLGRTFQIPQPLHQLTVRENLVVAQRFGTGRVDETRIAEVLDFTGLAGKAGRDAATGLALTELKALEVAKALATNPRLLLLDEVLAGLETTAKRHFMGMLRDLHARFGVGIVIIEHDIETIGDLCRRVAVLDAGRLIADGTPDAVFRDPAVMRSYLGTGAAHA
ncbi:ABC transporter ATP-binding protein [Pseudoduganella chitinolytica]|uniref:ABC transporter ATP-binding protein n=1 Tax=Pseudoduganella chitinolytica TaxID=34070 RepID=A0ABY8BDG6_9BURK|nr:ABC transporter ATP-binding protein [Pseudoduganella chitinolytica]WEF33960.1 ABC transporter ATP-binding protein [Pseudoduganella chitinolytica]